MVSRDDFEIGTEPIEVERKPRAGVVISVRLSPDEAEQFQKIAEERGMTVSQIARQALGAFLHATPERQPAFAPWTSTVRKNCSLAVSWHTPRPPNLYTRGDEDRSGRTATIEVPQHALPGRSG